MRNRGLTIRGYQFKFRSFFDQKFDFLIKIYSVSEQIQIKIGQNLIKNPLKIQKHAFKTEIFYQKLIKF